MATENKGLRYKDKVVIVTGGCKGIGRGCVNVFTENGGKVAVLDIDDEEGAKLNGPQAAGEVLYIHCDMTKEEQVKVAITKTVEHFGKLDCLINNAGWHPPAKTIDDFSSDDFRNLLELNLVGYFVCCKYALPHIRQSKGNIINMSSGAHTGQPDAVTYCATKGGVSAMTRALAMDEAKHRVRVNSISPGSTVTPMLKEWLDSLTPDEYKKALNMNVFGRFCQPEEIGSMCLFLATDATFVTGEDISACGLSERGLWK